MYFTSSPMLCSLVCSDLLRWTTIQPPNFIFQSLPFYFHYPCTPPFHYRTDRSLRSSIHTRFIIPAPLRSVTAQTGVYDHPYTRVSLSLHPSVPLPHRPEFTIIRTHEFNYPCTPPFRYRTDRSLRSSVHTSFIITAPLRSVTAQTGVYDHPYTRVSLSLHPSVPLPHRPEFTIIRTHEFQYPCTHPFRYRTDRSLRSSVHSCVRMIPKLRSVR